MKIDRNLYKKRDYKLYPLNSSRYILLTSNGIVKHPSHPGFAFRDRMRCIRRRLQKSAASMVDVENTQASAFEFRSPDVVVEKS